MSPRLILLVAVLSSPLAAAEVPPPGDELVLKLAGELPGGISLLRVDWSAAAAHLYRRPPGVPSVEIRAGSSGPLPSRFIPDPDFDPQARARGILILDAPSVLPPLLRARLAEAGGDRPAPGWDGRIRTGRFAVVHDAKRQGGLPSRIEFSAADKVFETLRWNDRLFEPGRGGFYLREDPRSRVDLLAMGSPASVVRVRARYEAAGAGGEGGGAEAVYDWYYFQGSPLVFVRAMMSQPSPRAWRELHFLELSYPDRSFPRWACGEPLKEGEFLAAGESFHAAQWGALIDGRSAIAVLQGGVCVFHDGRGAYGTYLHAHGEKAWRGWSDTRRELSAWLWIGAAENPSGEIRAAAQQVSPPIRAVASLPPIHGAIETFAEEALKLEGEALRSARWRIAIALRLESEGRFDEIQPLLRGETPRGWSLLAAGDLRLALRYGGEGVRLASLLDAAAGRELLADEQPPLFTAVLRHVETGELSGLTAGEGWQEVSLVEKGVSIAIDWRRPAAKRFAGVRIQARVEAGASEHALRWTLRVDNESKEWSTWRVAFPQIAVREMGPSTALLYPRGPGAVSREAFRSEFRYQGTYPSGWTTMQLLAVYDESASTGLYFAHHDPLAAVKDIKAESRPDDRSLLLAYEHPAAGMGKPGNSFILGGEALWRLLRGDWFDAAVIYRGWARAEARWFPPLEAGGRTDTPLWMKELPVWVLSGGAPETCVSAVKRFAEFMGRPVGLHWYNWHRIPFDNDYPHYFPAKEGFAAGVEELQAAGVRVMPYINGRLWDTRDRGSEDFEFSKIARPAATKDEKGEPCTETYGSREADGSPVQLAVMCPSTETWREKIRSIVARLFGECGVDAVYIDQIAAAAPRLCFDESHGHPSGGGAWWVESYGRMLDAIRADRPEGRALTTECTAEPYARWIDGLLSWDWQYEGQVPVFPAIYGGAVQMFGRSYGAGPTASLSLRMKAGQQLVFGEQLGWIHPEVLQRKEDAEFLRQLVHLRWEARRFFSAGEMARPPRLGGSIPVVRGDWQWRGETWITSDALLTGAWLLPREKRLLVLAVNVSDEDLEAKLLLDAADHGIAGDEVDAKPIGDEAATESFTLRRPFAKDLAFPARQARAWEIRER
ncbi:MAG: hypothetical protein JXA90_00040 [Planctomycetes bacterium]|nr:hypothetical protein [Planctomycetota bacterium]